ncbi:hypothetical protein [Halomicrobium sp. LC1Hm]|uniref:hypothetical protein n=1 Tax=Halomicrobium sp. LC1Hm TaxID=2610902 RepID=UPI00129833F8|nr:hypothetical protein [Halomicrobium sp. LC1Hm]QGA81786.1 putative membrane protein [Halomicrobium sp. LC1Hm]
MSPPRVSRWSRRFVGAGAAALVAWAVLAPLGVGRRLAVVLLLYGFVLHTVFGKSYALVPSYFDRTLATPRAPAVQFPLSVVGVVALAVGTRPGVPGVVSTVGAVAWFAGVLVWLGALGWTVRDNRSGAATATGDHQSDRRPIDRVSNAAVPLVAGYLSVGSYALFAGAVGLPAPLGGVPARISHLLGAGGAALLVLAVGFRLFPRFLVAHPPRALVFVVLGAGSVGPALLAAGLDGGPLLVAGAVVEAVAILGFALAYGLLYRRSDRRRVGLRAVLAGVAAGVVTVGLATHLVFVGRAPAVVTLHYQFALVGFLGLTIVGAALQFYPPSVGVWPGSNDRTALASVSLLAVGLLCQLAGLVVPGATAVGRLAVLAGAVGYAYLLASAFVARG